MLFASWEVHIVKNCDWGDCLKNAAEAAGQGQHFQIQGQFFNIRTDPKLVNNLFIFSKLSNKKKNLEKNPPKRYGDHGQR